MPGRGHQLIHSDALSAEMEAIGLDSSLFGAAGLPAPIFQALMPRRADDFDGRAHTFGTADEPSTFTRALASYSRGPTGILSLAAANAIRPDYDEAGLFSGYLFEPAAENICRQSNAFSTSPWTIGSGLNRTATASTAPDGTLSAWELEDDDVTIGSASTDCGRLFNLESPASSIDPHIFSVWIKKTSGAPAVFPCIGLTMSGGTSEVKGLASFNTTTGAIAASGASTWAPAAAYDAAWVESFDDWWRVTLKISDNGTGNSVYRLRVYPAFSSTLAGEADGTLVGTVTIWQCVWIKGALAPTSPIPTAAAAVSRPADSLSWAVLPGGFSQGAGMAMAIVAQPFAYVNPATAAGLVTIANSADNLISVVAGASQSYRCWDGANSAAVAPPGGNLAAGERARLVSRWSGSAMSFGVYTAADGWNWSSSTTYDGAFVSNTKLEICRGLVVPQHISKVQLYNRDLGRTEIERLFSTA